MRVLSRLVTSRSEQLRAAACIGSDPQLFDAISWPDAEPALKICSHCPVKEVCERHVLGSRPRNSFFDGVAGGRVWRDGLVVPRPKQWKAPVHREYCGGIYGRRFHEEHEERYCFPCAVAFPVKYNQPTLDILAENE